MPEQSNDYRVTVFGAGGVGKSSLVLRFVRGTFRENYVPTVEDTYRQVVSGKGSDRHVCTLQITDTTGSHQFPAMQRLNISQGHAFILVFSITNRQSLEELKPIYQDICQIKGDINSVPMMLVGNKHDETDGGRDVTSQEAMALAKVWKCGYIETSAKTNHNVQELFQELMNKKAAKAGGGAGAGGGAAGTAGGVAGAAAAATGNSESPLAKAKASSASIASDKNKSPGGADKNKLTGGGAAEKNKSTGGATEKNKSTGGAAAKTAAATKTKATDDKKATAGADGQAGKCSVM